MSPPSQDVKSGTRIQAIRILTRLALGLVVASPIVVGVSSEVYDWGDETPGPQTRCTLAHVRAESWALELLALDAGGAPYAYGIARTCADPKDGGVPEVPEGITVLEDLDEAVAYDGGATMTVWLGTAAPWKCACAPRERTCEADAGDCTPVVNGCEFQPAGDGVWVAAPPDTTLASGTWRTSDAGSPCVRKICNEVSGYLSMPEECQ